MTRRRRHRYWRRCAATLVLGGLFALMLAPRPAETEAAWTDAERGTATFTAITVPAPTGRDCSIVGSLLNLLGSSMTLRWQLPAGVPIENASITHTGANGLVPVVDTLLGSNLKTTQTGGTYSTTLSGTLLNAALGAERTLEVWIVDPSGWESDRIRLTGNWPALGLGQATCVVSTVPKA